MYVPNNVNLFAAAFSGALAGMGVSDRVPSDPTVADYAGLAAVAGAFSQAFDTEWGATPPNGLELLEIQEVCTTAWQDRAPQPTAENLSPATYLTLVRALIAIVHSGDAYFLAMGIPIPPAGGGGTDYKESCRLATTANIVLVGLQVIDGVITAPGDRILVKNQFAAQDNGLYNADVGAWTRTADADTSALVTSGMFTTIEEGGENADTAWILATNNPITLGTTPLLFILYPQQAVIFDGGTTSKNLRSQRPANQSPIDNTKDGIVNLGSNTGAAVGAVGNYATIAGGDQNTAREDYCTVAGGNQNVAKAIGGTIAGGALNTAGTTSDYGAIGGGNNNFVDGIYCTIAGGLSNTCNDSKCAIGGGESNLINTDGGDPGTIAGGSSNVIQGNGGSVGGGKSNTAHSYATVPGGLGNTASGLHSYAAGNGCTASGNDALALGTGCLASGIGSAAFGQNCTASGNSAVASGNGSIASAKNAVATGSFGLAARPCEVSHGSMVDPVAMFQTQHAGIDMGVRVFNANPTVLTDCDGNEFILEDDTTYSFQIKLTASRQDAQGCALFVHELLVHASGGVAVIDSDTSTLSVPNGEAWTFAIAAPGGLTFRMVFAGTVGQTVDAVATLTYTSLAGA